MKQTLLTLFVLCLSTSLSLLKAQDPLKNEEDHAYKPLKLNLNESGTKYLRFLMWHQIWTTSNNLSNESQDFDLTTSIRRSRMLAFAQISPKFLVLTHFGLNGLNQNNLTSLGNTGDSPQLFLHGAWGEYRLHKSIYLGAGLHYWKGMTRLANQSTLNFMTLDQSRPFYAWHSLGITDQFARHLGLYLKGEVGKVEYRLAWNNPGRNPLGAGADYSGRFNSNGEPSSTLVYNGSVNLDRDGNSTGNHIIEGYAKYNFFDSESVKLPYYVGTYLGKKKVLAVGAGFFLHPNGMYDLQDQEHVDVSHFAVDAFLDMPVSGGALNAYVAFQNFNYGSNYISRWAGTGNTLYTQVGYYLSQARLMPYIAYSNGSFEGATEPITSLDLGVNYYINGHNAKVTAEYHSIKNDYREGSMTFGQQDVFTQFRLQFHFFL